MSFQLLQTDSETNARLGVVTTAHGEITTPIFMPVGTQGTVKTLTPQNLNDAGAEIILGNTYHLYLRPSREVLENAGGLHPFMHWDKPILTDSGGFQVFSLKELTKMYSYGVEFRSHIDGSKHLFTPESVVDIQRSIGSDIMMVLDECPPNPSSFEYVKKSIALTTSWAKKSREHFLSTTGYYGFPQLQFSIGQGSIYPTLRKESIEQLCEIGFDGYAIGGLAVGETTEQMYEILDTVLPSYPKESPRYLMGVGTPANILRAIQKGVDMFDCVMPTRNARNGTLFTTTGKINIRNLKYRMNLEPIDAGLGDIYTNNFSLSYLRHLFISGETLGLHLATLQNISFYMWLVRTAKEKIRNGTFRQWSNNFIETYYPEKNV